MSHLGKLTFFYLTTAPMGNSIGCFKAGMAAMIEEFRMDDETFEVTFKECCLKGFVEYDDYNRVLYIPNYFFRNLPANPNGIAAMGKDFVRVPNSPLKAKCYQVIMEWCREKESKEDLMFKTFLRTFGDTLPVSQSEPSRKRPGTICSDSHSDSHSDSTSILPNGNKKEKSKPKKKSPYSPSFEAFWAVYPKQRSKGDANKAWGQMKKNGNWPGDDVVIEALKRLSVSPDWIADGGKFVPYPGKWLRAAGWEDEPTTKTNGQLEYDFSEYEEIMKKMEVAK
jgi:hypothetical protein